MPLKQMTSSVNSMIHSLMDRMAHDARIRRDMEGLRERPDHELKDVGLVWTDIDHAVRYGRRPG